MRKQKSKWQVRLERFFQVNQEPIPLKKSKFQLEHQNKETREDRDNPNVNLHDEDNPIPWISTLDELPPYYISVDIYVNGDVHEDWHRVSNGEIDYFCNPRNNRITTFVSHWRKRKGVNYNPYEPLTTHDIPILSTSDVYDIISTLDGLINKTPKTSFMVHHNSAVAQCISIIEETLKEKTQSTLLSGDTSVRNTGEVTRK